MIQTRPATPSDLHILVEFWHERALLQQVRLASDARERWMAAAAELLENPDITVFVGVNDEGHPVGYITGRIQASPPGILPEVQGVITEIAVDAHQYHRGAARLLFDAARAWFRSREVEQIMIIVSQRSAVEQAFWRGLGAVKGMELLWIK